MRLVALLFLGLTCCDALAERPRAHDSMPDPATAGSAGSGGRAGSVAFEVPVLTVGGAQVVEHEPDWCETAERNGATFCNADKPSTLEYCEPAPVAQDGAGVGGVGGDGVGGDGVGGDGVGGDGVGGDGRTSLGGQTCIAYDRPPEWVYDLVIQCYAHCGVGISMSERVLEGSCCYTAVSEYYGR